MFVVPQRIRTVAILGTASVLLAVCSRPYSDAPSQADTVQSDRAPARVVTSNGWVDTTGSWTFGSETDPMDDARTLTLVTGAANADAAMHAEAGRPILAVKCERGNTHVLLGGLADVELRQFRNPVPDLKKVGGNIVRLRFDTLPPTRDIWVGEWGRHALYASEPIPLARQMLAHDTLRVEYTTASDEPAVLTFGLVGLERHLPALAAMCGWKA